MSEMTTGERLNGVEIFVGDLLTWSDWYGVVIADVKYGKWYQDGSGGEYIGTLCKGFYVHIIDVRPASWSIDTQEEAKENFPEYIKNYSLVALLNDDLLVDKGSLRIYLSNSD